MIKKLLVYRESKDDPLLQLPTHTPHSVTSEIFFCDTSLGLLRASEEAQTGVMTL